MELGCRSSVSFPHSLTPQVNNTSSDCCRNSNNQNINPNTYPNLTVPWTCWNFLKGPWRSLDHTLEINNRAQATPKVQHYRVHRDFLVCVTSPWRGFDSLKCFPQSENSTTQLDIALHHKVNALSVDPYKPCGLRCKVPWLHDSARILTVCMFGFVFLKSLLDFLLQQQDRVTVIACCGSE